MRPSMLACFALLLAGCTDPIDLRPLEVLDVLSPHEGFTWPPLLVTNGTGAILRDSPLVQTPTDLPYYIQQMVGRVGAEPNVAITEDGSILVSTLDQVQRSRDHGRTWETVLDFVSPGVPVSPDRWGTADPMLWMDPDTNRVYMSHMHPALMCVYLAWTDDNGDTWTERPYFCGAIPLTDHQKVATSRPGPRAPAVPARGYENVVYVCAAKPFNAPVQPLQGVPAYNQSFGTWCTVSLDGGRTVAYDRIAAEPELNCPPQNGNPAPFPDGTIAVPLAGGLGTSCPRGPTVVVSEDNGVTWERRSMPGDHFQMELDPDIVVTPDGVAYMLYRADDKAIYLTRSADKFRTWEGPWLISPKDLTLTVFTAITGFDNGRIAMAYLGTRTPQESDAVESTAAQGSLWHLYVTSTIDGLSPDPTFVTQQVTPHEDPVQIGCVWLLGGGGGPYACRNLLDFIDMSVGPDGRAYVAFTDGCTPRSGCTGDPGAFDGQSRDSQVAVAVLERGWGLRADTPILGPLGLQPPAPVPRTSAENGS